MTVVGWLACVMVAVPSAVGWALAPIDSAAGQPGDLDLASVSAGGLKGDGHSTAVSLSADGLRVAFVSTADNLHPDDTDTLPDVYVKDLVTGELTLASVTADGVKGDGASQAPSLSGDGMTVAFASSAANLDPADPGRGMDIYIKDLATGEVGVVSTSATGVKGDGGSIQPSLAADGTRVAFASQAANFDPADADHDLDVYVKDLVSASVILVSTSGAGVKGDGASDLPALSGDGGRVGFRSVAANLAPEDTDTVRDIFVKDLESGSLTLASSTSAGVKGDGASDAPSLSADGSQVAFSSVAANLGDDALSDNVFVKDLASGVLTVASTSTSGVVGGADSIAPSLAADGTRVAFLSSARDLDPLDPDAALDVYVKDLETGRLILASTTPGGTKANGGSGDVPSISADGAAVAFQSNASNLDPVDTDTVTDAYVKDVGFTEFCDGVGATIVGTDGPDVIEGTEGPDVIHAGDGDDVVNGLGGNDRVCAGPGDDTVDGGTAADRLFGGDGADHLEGGGAADLLVGGDGPDTAFGGVGADTLVGGIGGDDLDGGGDDDVVVGGVGGDELWGGGGTDTLTGGAGADFLSGGADADVVSGGDGEDELLGGDGVDTLDGGADPDTVTGGLGADVAHGDGGGDTVNGGAGADTLWGDVGSDVINGGDGKDTVFGLGGADELNGGAGAEIMFGGDGADDLNGGAGTDVCAGGAGVDTGLACETVSGIP